MQGFAQQPKKILKPISSLVHVYKNKFVNEKGDTILFRGLSISDPDKIQRQGHWNKYHFEKVKEMGAMLVGIPLNYVSVLLHILLAKAHSVHEAFALNFAG